MSPGKSYSHDNDFKITMTRKLNENMNKYQSENYDNTVEWNNENNSRNENRI